jgi:hypothetical protein
MRTIQVQTVSRLGSAFAIDQAAVFGLLGRWIAALLGRRARGNREAVPHYEGHAWCDSLEQQVNGDAVNCRRRF